MAAAKLLCVAVFFLCMFPRRAAAQNGFLSIDCGSNSKGIYTDGLGIDWVGDERYTSHGANAVVDTSKGESRSQRFARPEKTTDAAYTLEDYFMTNIFRIDCGRKPGSPSIRYPDDAVDRIWAADPQNFSFPSVTKTDETSATQNGSFPVTANEMYQASGFTTITPSIEVTVIPSANSSVPVAILNGVEAWGMQFYNSSVITSTSAVTAIQGIKEHFNLSLWQGDPCLAWPYDWLTCTQVITSGETTVEITSVSLRNFNLTGTIPTVIGQLAELRELSMGNNNLTGSIPDLSKLTKLKYLRLQDNSLSGPIPEFLGSLPLTLLSLDNNLFEGKVPRSIREKIDAGVLTFSATSNPFLCLEENNCTHAVAPAPQRSSGKNNSSSAGAIIGAVIGGFVLLGLILFASYWRFSKKPDPKPGVEVGHGGGGESSRSANTFSWSEVSTITKNFSILLGKGGFGDVFYGELPNGQKVAVKVNKDNTRHSNEQFLNEVSLLSRVHHRHLVSFIGFCNEGNHEILIYEYMAEGTLEDHLLGKRNTGYGPLNWKTRLDIVLNASRGIEYLHQSCNPPNHSPRYQNGKHPLKRAVTGKSLRLWYI
ncbi:hypothetical protein R1sor_003549 [Riccia sorocarpa]|uniref:Protein kinase domain-containing protein n=1 Tax=Riccia sorocarpa TaxID=122646 RepID=A0ABD3H4N4_9MARC